MARRRTSPVIWLRRTCQATSLLLFVSFFLQTVYQPINQTALFVALFFQFDPLSALSVGVGEHTIPSGLWLGGLTLLATFLAGRWFCGWVCPFGALHHLFTASRPHPVKARIASGDYSSWQRAKYVLFAVLLGGCLIGVNLFGLLDPFSFFFRALTLAVYPVVNDAVGTAFAAIYRADPTWLGFKATAVTEPVYDVLRRLVLATAQPHYRGTLLVAVLFVGVVGLNFFRARFWCRYLCPLGALLGIIGKNPLVRLQRRDEACNDCGLCVADCQGGANPAGANAWKPAECFYCLNCQSACTRQALTFGPGLGSRGGA